MRRSLTKKAPPNYFVNETSKPSPALTMIKSQKKAQTEQFSVGERVRHMTFGEGVIMSSKSMGGDTLYEIAFDRVGTKKLMGSFAKLTKA